MNKFTFSTLVFLIIGCFFSVITHANSCRFSPNRFTYFENDAHIIDSLGVSKTKLAARYQLEFTNYKVATLADTNFLIGLYDKVLKKSKTYNISSQEAQQLNSLNSKFNFSKNDVIEPKQIEKIFLAVNYYLAQKKATQSAYFYKSLDKEAVLQESLNSLVLSLRDDSLRNKTKENPLIFYSAFYRKAAKWINRLRFDNYSGGSQIMKLNEYKLREFVNFDLERKKLEQKYMRELSTKEYFEAAKKAYPKSKYTTDLGTFANFIESVRHNQDGYKNYMSVWQVDSDVFLADSAFIDLLIYSKDLNADTFEQYLRKFSIEQVRSAISRTNRLNQKIISLRFFQNMSRESVHEIISYWLNFDITVPNYRSLERRAFISFRKELEGLL